MSSMTQTNSTTGNVRVGKIYNKYTQPKEEEEQQIQRPYPNFVGPMPQRQSIMPQFTQTQERPSIERMSISPQPRQQSVQQIKPKQQPKPKQQIKPQPKPQPKEFVGPRRPQVKEGQVNYPPRSLVPKEQKIKNYEESVDFVGPRRPKQETVREVKPKLDMSRVTGSFSLQQKTQQPKPDIPLGVELKMKGLSPSYVPDVQNTAREIALYNAKANKAQEKNIFNKNPARDKQLEIERQKLIIKIKNQHSGSKPEKLLTDIKNKKQGDIDTNKLTENLAAQIPEGAVSFPPDETKKRERLLQPAMMSMPTDEEKEQLEKAKSRESTFGLLKESIVKSFQGESPRVFEGYTGEQKYGRTDIQEKDIGAQYLGTALGTGAAIWSVSNPIPKALGAVGTAGQTVIGEVIKYAPKLKTAARIAVPLITGIGTYKAGSTATTALRPEEAQYVIDTQDKLKIQDDSGQVVTGDKALKVIADKARGDEFNELKRRRPDESGVGNFASTAVQTAFPALSKEKETFYKSTENQLRQMGIPENEVKVLADEVLRQRRGNDAAELVALLGSEAAANVAGGADEAASLYNLGSKNLDKTLTKTQMVAFNKLSKPQQTEVLIKIGAEKLNSLPWKQRFWFNAKTRKIAGFIEGSTTGAVLADSRTTQPILPGIKTVKGTAAYDSTTDKSVPVETFSLTRKEYDERKKLEESQKPTDKYSKVTQVIGEGLQKGYGVKDYVGAFYDTTKDNYDKDQQEGNLKSIVVDDKQFTNKIYNIQEDDGSITSIREGIKTEEIPDRSVFVPGKVLLTGLGGGLGVLTAGGFAGLEGIAKPWTIGKLKVGEYLTSAGGYGLDVPEAPGDFVTSIFYPGKKYISSKTGSGSISTALGFATTKQTGEDIISQGSVTQTKSDVKIETESPSFIDQRTSAQKKAKTKINEMMNTKVDELIKQENKQLDATPVLQIQSTKDETISEDFFKPKGNTQFIGTKTSSEIFNTGTPNKGEIPSDVPSDIPAEIPSDVPGESSSNSDSSSSSSSNANTDTNTNTNTNAQAYAEAFVNPFVMTPKNFKGFFPFERGIGKKYGGYVLGYTYTNKIKDLGKDWKDKLKKKGKLLGPEELLMGEKKTGLEGVWEDTTTTPTGINANIYGGARTGLGMLPTNLNTQMMPSNYMQQPQQMYGPKPKTTKQVVKERLQSATTNAFGRQRTKDEKLQLLKRNNVNLKNGMAKTKISNTLIRGKV